MNLKYKSLPVIGSEVNYHNNTWGFKPILCAFDSFVVKISRRNCSFLAHTSDINDLLEGLDGVLEDWLDGLHDTESSLHIVNLWLHTLDGLHLSGDLNEWLSIIESLEDSGGEGLLDVLDGSGLGNGGVTITSGLGSLGGGEGGLEVDEELILGHGVVLGGGDSGDKGEEFHVKKIIYLLNLIKVHLINIRLYRRNLTI